MTGRRYRPLMALVALSMGLAGAFSLVFLGGSRPATAAYTRYTIEISDTAVNPSVCNISRSDEVVWKNIGTKTHRIVVPDAGTSPPIPLTDDIPPGTTSNPVNLGGGTKLNYFDAYDSSIRGVLETPGTANDQAASCSPLPPTPTPTPTRTPPKPTPTPVVPAGCKWIGCALAPEVATD